MQELWTQLRDHLSVSIQTEIEADDTNQPVRIEFIVTNTASAMPDSAEISFEDVTLEVGVPPDLHRAELGDLSPGDSASYEHRCRYSELPDIAYELAGTVSPEVFFRTRTSGKLPGDPMLPIEAYVEAFRELSIHQWLQSVLKSVPIPSPDTTLAQLEASGKPLGEALPEIRDAERRLGSLAGRVMGLHRDSAIRHGKTVRQYLEETVQAIGAVNRSLNSRDAKQIGDSVRRAVSRLEEQATKVDAETEALDAKPS